MVARGHKVFACAPVAPGQVREMLGERGIEYRDVKLRRAGMNPVHDIQTVFFLVQLFKQLKPEVFFGYTIKPVVYGSIAARIAHVPRIFSMITGLGYAFSDMGLKSRITGGIAGNLYRLGLRYNNRVFFQNPDDLNLFQEKRLIKEARQAVLVNGSGVDIDAFSEAPYPTEISFLLIARLIRDKGVCEYVEAAHKIKKRYPNVKFRLVGSLDGNPTAISQQQLDSWIESGTIEYLGYLQDVRPAIANSSIYVLPSYREGTPRSVLEAMAMGRPIITTDAPGCRETVQQRVNGFLVPVRDASALAQAMEYFIQQPEHIQKMGYESRLIAVQKYDVQKVNALMLQTMAL
jgi:glycosyltransferase involved in cell wall biosynthesis